MRVVAGEEPVAEPSVAGDGGSGWSAVPVDLRHGSRQDGHWRPGLHLLSRHHKGNLIWPRLRDLPTVLGLVLAFVKWYCSSGCFPSHVWCCLVLELQCLLQYKT
jgi:hypothetical protein